MGIGSTKTDFYEDDGISADPKYFQTFIELRWNADLVEIDYKVVKADWKPAYSKISMILPALEKRPVKLNGIIVESDSNVYMNFPKTNYNDDGVSFRICRRNYI